ncbi:hypothetical protein [Apilactobacillus kunkeei]|uniref:hypothetical protein n=1 Tax=Apilactobacillus kunkeei TaxID=148814 RepID=UPI0011295619|nr:hypothetical protein [Apilactobacillus kunkeei]TPR53141.1 hypothetical protein DY036_06855 [Apilactobacillus kunkeei]
MNKTGSDSLQMFKERIEKRYYYFCIFLFDVLVGFYGLFHLNYLDNPQFTLVHHHKEKLDFLGGMTDDLWFNTLLITVGIILLLGILSNKRKLSNVAYVISIFMVVLVCTAFSIRGVFETHYNIEWAISFVLILMAIHGPREDGGKK